MAKTFKGSYVVLILLLICCWPAALVYFFMKYTEIALGMPPQPYPQQQQYAPQQPAPAAGVCPTCGGPLTFVPQYNRNYCYKCQKYA